MSDLIKINNKSISVKEFQGQRVVTFKEIDEVHGLKTNTSSRNFYNNQTRFIEGRDYFKVSGDELLSVNFTDKAPRGLLLITESGYLMLVKSLTDNLSWQVQRQLVDTYFKVKAIDPMLEMMMKDPIMAMRYNQIQMEERIKATETKLQITEARIDNLDTINIKGTERQRLNAMVRKYSLKEGILYNTAWNQFKQAFNTAYHTNLEYLITAFQKKHNMKKLTTPEYLTLSGKIEDALRVADKMLNIA